MTAHRSFSSTASAILLFILLAPMAKALQNGEAVCAEGYIMDNFCIDRGTLLDRPDVVTLERPELHSVHCLVDVGACRNSGFVILQDPTLAGTLYTLGYEVDVAGTTLLTNLARQVGNGNGCSTCTPGGNLGEGFRAGVLGTVLDATANPPLIRVDLAVPVDVSIQWCATQQVGPVTVAPTKMPSMHPSPLPTSGPIAHPSVTPSTTFPSVSPSSVPTVIPTAIPSALPTTDTAFPTVAPTTATPTISLAPSVAPTSLPTLSLSIVPSNTSTSVVNTMMPTVTTLSDVTAPPVASNTTFQATQQADVNKSSSMSNASAAFLVGCIDGASTFTVFIVAVGLMV